MKANVLQFINTALYPINDLTSIKEELARYKAALYEDGALVLPEFVAPEFFPQLLAQAQSVMGLAYHNALTGNAYLDEIDPSLPEDHARRLTDTTKLGAIAYDQIPQEFIIRQIYEFQPVREFIQAIVDDGPLYPYNCNMGALNLTVMVDGEYLRWHFDQSDFVVSIPLQDSEQGGDFEYVRYLRSPEKENYEEVREILMGDRRRVEILDAQPGSLILFRGMNTLHRVSEIKGDTPRLGALLSYVNDPKVGSSEYLKKIRYGRI